ncbi:MAG: hypothetical protein ACI4U5_02400 [Bacilli bacterium]
MKKRVLVLALIPLFTLASCGKTVTKQEAIDFANETYDYSKVEYTKCSTKMVEKVTKAEGIFATTLEVGESKETIDDTIADLKFTANVSGFTDDYKFTISGKKITVTYSQSAKDFLKGAGFDTSSVEKSTVKGKGVKESFYYNELGLLEKATMSIDASFSMTNMGVTVSGAITYSVVCTNLYS